MRQNPISDVGIELGEPLFGDPGLLPQDALGMGQSYAGETGSRLLSRCCGRRRHFQGDVGGGLVLAQALERGVENEPVPAPGAELDLADELRLGPAHALLGARGQCVDQCRLGCVDLFQRVAQRTRL